jgi:hypothetical protein
MTDAVGRLAAPGLPHAVIDPGPPGRDARFSTRPSVVDLEFEMDRRGVTRETVI